MRILDGVARTSPWSDGGRSCQRFFRGYSSQLGGSGTSFHWYIYVCVGIYADLLVYMRATAYLYVSYAVSVFADIILMVVILRWRLNDQVGSLRRICYDYSDGTSMVEMLPDE